MSVYDGVNAAGNKTGAILNAYPDSIGDRLQDAVAFLKKAELKDVFRSFYILPSVFNSDLDRGFSVIDYNLNEDLAQLDDLASLKELDISLILDFVLNHASVLSPQFRDILLNGDTSEYKDFFIDWNQFWSGCGQMTEAGFIQPEPQYLKEMFFRKPGLPFLMINFPDGTSRPYWNTFYQEVSYDTLDAQDLVFATNLQYTAALRLAKIVNEEIALGKSPEEIDYADFHEFKADVSALLRRRCKYLGQMDLSIKSPLVWKFYEETLRKLAGYGADVVRLDAFAYAPKEPGSRNFLNDPGTWDFLAKLRRLADRDKLTLLPEIHFEYREKIHEKLSAEGYLTYDFFLPGLIIHAMEKGTSEYLYRWLCDIREKGIRTINMLGCHDGIPILDLRGLLPEEEIDTLIQTIVDRGGYVKDLHGNSNMYYQVNATYYSAIGEDDSKMLLARAIQLFMPGRPQVWYLDLFGGKNDHDAVRRAGVGGHKEINRTNLTISEMENMLKEDLVATQLQLLRLRNTCPAFGLGGDWIIKNTDTSKLEIQWEGGGYVAALSADLAKTSFSVKVLNESSEVVFIMRRERGR